MRSGSRARLLAVAVIAVVALGACTSGAPAAWTAGPAATASLSAASPSAAAAASGSTTNVTRPSSTAQLTIVSPTANQVVTGSSLHVVVGLTGATIVTATSTDIRPDQGHIHLYIDNNLVSMNYGTTQDVPAVPGTHVLRAEFVASDHFPFNPRVVTPDVIFTVQP
jgi:hypothetical protein